MADHAQVDGTALTIDGCGHVEDYAPLLADPEMRGDDTLVPGDADVIETPIRPTITVVNLNMLIFGWRDPEGAAHANVRTGLALNKAHLQALVTTPPTPPDVTRTCTLHWTGLTTLTKPVHVLGLDTAGYGPNALRGVLRLRFPQGLFDLTEWV